MIYLFYKTNEEVNCTEAPPSVSILCLELALEGSTEKVLKMLPL